MSYLVLARKWRPKGFEDLVGQGPIMRILTNAIKQGKIAHAYIFSGPRGVGKTSSARILARALNCQEGPIPVPCGTCPSCVSISDGSSVDVIEIDGASNNSVDDVRDIRERVRYAPSSARYKVYIIDEVHMLSGSAFNALLKTLEEPPAHVIFVLATTEMKKIPATVVSRCQHMPFRSIPAAEIRARLKFISEAEGISISPAALGLVARAAEGSMRDSLTILDQVSSFTSEVTEESVKSLLGVTGFGPLSEIARALFTGDRAAILREVDALAQQGSDVRTFTKELIQFLRDLLVAGIVKNPAEVLDLSTEELTAIEEILPLAGEDLMTLMLAEIMKADADVRYASAPRLALEMALIKASFLSSMTPVIEAIERLGGSDSGSSAATRQTTADQPRPIRKNPPKPLQTAEVVESKPAAVPETPPEDMNPATRPEALPRQAGPEIVPASGDLASAWKQLLAGVDPPLASKLAQIHYELKEDELHLILNGGQAFFEDSIKENRRDIEGRMSAAYGSKLKVKISVASKKAPRKKSGLKEKVMEEPLIKEALELFEGRIVDVTSVEAGNDKENTLPEGGDDV